MRSAEQKHFCFTFFIYFVLLFFFLKFLLNFPYNSNISSCERKENHSSLFFTFQFTIFFSSKSLLNQVFCHSLQNLEHCQSKTSSDPIQSTGIRLTLMYGSFMVSYKSPSPFSVKALTPSYTSPHISPKPSLLIFLFHLFSKHSHQKSTFLSKT